MNSRSNHAVGAIHPVLFFVLVYGISILLSFFICNAVYNSLLATPNAPVSADVVAHTDVTALQH